MESLSKRLRIHIALQLVLAALAAWLVAGAAADPGASATHAARLSVLGVVLASVIVSGMTTLRASLREAEKRERLEMERRRAEEELRREHDYANSIVACTPALVCGVAPDGTTLFVNPAVEAATGYAAWELIGQNWWRMLYPGDSYAQVERLYQEFATSGDVWDHEMELTTRDGATRVVSWSSMRWCDASGKLVEILGFGNDITARREAEKARARLDIQLRHAQKLEAIGQLAAGIAHEINTPTQYIGDNIHFLGESFASLARVLDAYERIDAPEGRLPNLEEARRVADDADVRYLAAEIPRAIQQSLEGVERVARIVRAMKEFSHPGSDQRTLVDLNHAIESTVTVATNEWKYVADLRLELDDTLPPVPAFRNELTQAILNLVVNAAHAIGERPQPEPRGKGTITVSTRFVDGFAEVRVGDTGTGIAPAIRGRIFDPFFTTKPVGKGSGQGLSICHSVIVDRHGGTVDFETEVGVGTTFVVRLPLAYAAESALEAVA
jgi:PAS domain S-box-containing protein